MSQTTTVPVNQEACCSLLAKAYGRIVREGAALSREINIAERPYFAYGGMPTVDQLIAYNSRLAAIQFFQLNTLQIAAAAFSCDGINTKCCEGYAQGLADDFLGLLEQTIHNTYQVTLQLGEKPVEGPIDPENPDAEPPLIIPEQDAGTVWGNIAVALQAAVQLAINNAQITGSSCTSLGQ